MNITRSLLALSLACGISLRAQEVVIPTVPVTPDARAIASAPIALTAEQLDQLLGPIALYPDALIALILPAAASSSDIVLAARYLQTGGDPAQGDNQPWEESVRGLVRYPDVIKWMDENLAWTKQLGEAFITQPTEVMNAVQRLRTAARTAGTLMDTPQQQIVVEDRTITIVPAQPDVIYVPYYDPAVVYLPRPVYYDYSYPTSFLSFSPGFAAGFWLSHRLDWGHRRVCVIHYSERERYWRDHRHDWHRPHVTRPVYTDASRYRSWTPSPNFNHQRRTNFTSRIDIPAVRSGPVDHRPSQPARDFTTGPRYNRDNGNRSSDRSGPPANGSAGSRRTFTPTTTAAVVSPAPVRQPPLPRPSAQPSPSVTRSPNAPGAGSSANRSPGHDTNRRESTNISAGSRRVYTPPATTPVYTPPPVPQLRRPDPAPQVAPPQVRSSPAPAMGYPNHRPQTDNGSRHNGQRSFQNATPRESSPAPAATRSTASVQSAPPPQAAASRAPAGPPPSASIRPSPHQQDTSSAPAPSRSESRSERGRR